jgi:hypothetical protein
LALRAPPRCTDCKVGPGRLRCRSPRPR